MKKTILALISLLAYNGFCFAAPTNSISIPNSFSPNTIISSSQMNANFNEASTKFNAHNHTDITALGTVTTGTWNASVLGVSYGGTGSATQNFVDLTTAQTVAGAKTFSDIVKLADGTAAAPSLTFTNDAGNNTGFYLGGANSMSGSAGGTQVFTMNVNGITATGSTANAALSVSNNSTGSHMNFSDNAAPTSVDGDFWFTASNVRCNLAGTGYNFDLTAVSDERSKKNIKDTKYGLKELMRLPVKEFNYKEKFGDDTVEHTGLIAQDVLAVYPYAVGQVLEKGEMMYYVDYKKLIPVLIKSIQEQDKKITALEARLTALENK